MTTSAPCKQTQHCCLVTPNILGCYMLRRTPCCMLLHVVACCAKFETGQTFEPTTPNISFVSWSPTYSATTFSQLFQHCWGHARALHMVSKFLRVVSFSRCTVNLNIAGSCCIRLYTTANTDITATKIRAQQCWEFLRPFARNFRNRWQTSSKYYEVFNLFIEFLASVDPFLFKME